MPDATAVAASHDAMQMLFYFICALGTFILGVSVWMAKHIAIPLRDTLIEYLKNQTAMASSVRQTLVDVGTVRQVMHEQNVERFIAIETVLRKIMGELNIRDDGGGA